MFFCNSSSYCLYSSCFKCFIIIIIWIFIKLSLQVTILYWLSVIVSFISSIISEIWENRKFIIHYIYWYFFYKFLSLNFGLSVGISKLYKIKLPNWILLSSMFFIASSSVSNCIDIFSCYLSIFCVLKQQHYYKNDRSFENYSSLKSKCLQDNLNVRGIIYIAWDYIYDL